MMLGAPTRSGVVSRISSFHCCSLLSPVFPRRLGILSIDTISSCSRRLKLDNSYSFERGKVLLYRSMASSTVHSLHNLANLSLTEDTSNLGSSSTTNTTAADDENLQLGGYRLPPDEIRKIVDAPPTPALSISPKRDKILFLKRRSLPQLSELAQPEEKLAGIRIDKNSNAGSRMSFYTGIGIHKLMDDDTLGPEMQIHGLPDDSKINYVCWSPNGCSIAFSVRFTQNDGTNSKLRLWVADIETGEARPLFNDPEIFLNTIFEGFVWIDDSTIAACTIPLSRGNRPERPIIPPGPKIESNEEKNIVQVRTYKDLLQDEYDSDLFDYYATAQLLFVRLDGTMEPVGPHAIYTSIDPSPDRKYILVTTIHRPYSYIVPCGRFPKKVELWNSDGKFIRELCDLPLAENIPIAFNSVRKGKRFINWRSDKPSSLYWVETQDGGDAKMEVSPRDIIYTESAEPQTENEPEILHKLDLRFGRVAWGDDSLALVSESWYKTRQTRTWVISPSNNEEQGRILFDRSSEDVYSDPGSPMLRRTSNGSYVLARIRKQDGSTYLLLNGNGATPEGNVPFLDLLDINTGEKERIWQSDKENFYECICSLMSDQHNGDLELSNLKVIISRESKIESPQFFLKSWRLEGIKQITNFPHPYPELANIQKEMIRYSRKDGVQLTATLYLPPGYQSERDGPLPTLVWAYPGEFKSKDAASQVRVSPNAFPGIGATSPLIFLSRGFAILSGPTIPIIGEGDAEANDRYVEQLVSSAEAAVEEVVKRGVAHPNKIAIGGHSYGAFMTANLLAHAPHLFSCGIARSGAYNRTLTPFGFQNEERTLWEATNTYIEMSPYLLAHKIKKPILLVHGEEDSNPGTLPMQSERFFKALQGHGTLCRLVILPYESHGYSGRESIMHLLWETDRWLQKFCVNQIDSNEDKKLSSPIVSAEKSFISVGHSENDQERISDCNILLSAPRSYL